MSEFVPHDPDVAAADSPAKPGVGFVGCDGRSRVLRVRVANLNRQRMRVECPHGCGVHETPKSMARPLRPDEAEPELVEIPPVDLERDPKDRGSGRRQVSDSAIFDAIPVGEEVLASEAAKALGYAVPKTGGQSGALLTRLRRMNVRAEKEGVPPPFAFTRRQVQAGSPLVFVKRTGGGKI
jgi:hypothetical protein